MTPSDSQPLLLFLHIPKTGGTTLENLICAEYGDRDDAVAFFEPGFCLAEPGLPAQMTGLGAALRPQTRAVTGHFVYGLHRHVRRPSIYLTLLRDPVDRVLSLYAHFFRWGDDRHGVSRGRLTLGQFVASVDCPDIDNGQTRRLCGDGAAGRSGREMLDVARSRLADGSVVAGLTERHRESVARFSGLFGWRAASPGPALVNSRRPGRERVPAPVIEQIRRRNALDAELLAYARTLFSLPPPARPGHCGPARPGTG